MCNVSLLAHAVAAMVLRLAKVPMVFWQQDVYSDAIGTAARNRLGRVAGGGLAMIADQIERAIARGSTRVIAISKSFRDVLQRWGGLGARRNGHSQLGRVARDASPTPQQ
jgi:colanic acid biosynthesis glycosyl transferase WcaI